MTQKSNKESVKGVLVVLPISLWERIDHYAEKVELDRTKYLREKLTSLMLQEREHEKVAEAKEKEARQRFRNG